MSVWIVSKNHIDALVYWLGKTECLADVPTAQGLSADELGIVLWGENHRSVNYRYSEDTPLPAYAYERPRATDAGHGYSAFDPESVQHAYVVARCYDYQSCERPDWGVSASRAWTDALQAALIAAGADPEDYGNAPWGV